MKRLYEMVWWQKLFKKKEHTIKADFLTNVSNAIDFLEDAPVEATAIIDLLKQLEELEKEREVSNEKLISINLQTQADLLDKLLDRYEYFQNDVDINGIRIKRIADQFLKNAKKAGLSELIENRKDDYRWTFNW